MVEYEQGATVSFYPYFVNIETGEEAVISGTPTITISHMWGGGQTVDIDHDDMDLMSGTIYTYSWNIPRAADKTTYNVKYNAVFSGINLQSTNVVGGEEFQVITKKFYDGKAGGLTKTTIKKDTWTEKEKDAVLEALGDLVDRRKFDLSSVENRLSGFAKSFDTFSSDLKIGLVSKDYDLKKGLQELSDLISGLRSSVTSQYDELLRLKSSVEEIGSKPEYDDSAVKNKIGDISRNILALESNLRNEKFGLLISELGDLRKNLDDFQRAFSLTCSEEALERIKDELERDNLE